MTFTRPLRQTYRRVRVLGRQVLGIEPRIGISLRRPLEFHGNDAGGWSILRNSLDPRSVVVDAGLGEDVSFSESLIRQYGCVVSGFDPTPRAIQYVRRLNNDNLRFFELGIGIHAGRSAFFLPNNDKHVSGSVTQKAHLGARRIEVEMVTLGQVFAMLNCDTIDLLKLDIEGSEYDLIESAEFRRHASGIRQLCVEFHHRWESRGKKQTEDAVGVLRALGFECAWYAPSTNEEFLFVNLREPGSR